VTLARPRFSVVLVLGPGAPADAVVSTFASLRPQRYRDWELVVVERGAGSAQRVGPDARVRYVDVEPGLSASAASNRGLDAALGEFVVFHTPGDRLAVDALGSVARLIAATPGADLVYTDEDVNTGDDASMVTPHPKPDWSPERLRHGNYLDGFAAVRTSLARDVGGFDAAFEDAYEYDFILRVSEQARRILHVASVQAHRSVRAEPTVANQEAARRAAQAHLDRLQIDATVVRGTAPGYHRIRRPLPPSVKISIIVPTRGQSGPAWGEERCYVVESVRTALAKTAHQNLEIIVVYDEPTPPEVLEQLREIAGDRLVTVPYNAPFNFSEKCNLGFLHAQGDVIVLLNDDVQAISDNWLETLVAPLSEPDVGLVGARLLLPDGTLQHGGHVYAPTPGDLTLRHAFYRAPRDASGEQGSLLINRECSGVTAACAGLRREVYEQVGGLTEQLAGNYNDVDLCLKIRHLGLRILWMADSELYHFQSRTRSTTIHPHESAFIATRWGAFGRDAFTPGT
jgi:GT2 family glycosyltransferase